MTRDAPQAGPPPPARPDGSDLGEGDAPGSLGPLLVGGGLFAALALFVVWLLVGSDSPEFVYSQNVDAVMATPSEFRDKDIRVEGDLRRHSICFREDPCEWRFVLQGKGKSMPVRFPECVVPDTFRDMPGVTVTVQGRLVGESFVASQVVAKCPSRYDEKSHQMKGEGPTPRSRDDIPLTAVPNPC